MNERKRSDRDINYQSVHKTNTQNLFLLKKERTIFHEISSSQNGREWRCADNNSFNLSVCCFTSYVVPVTKQKYFHLIYVASKVHGSFSLEIIAYVIVWGRDVPIKPLANKILNSSQQGSTRCYFPDGYSWQSKNRKCSSTKSST